MIMRSKLQFFIRSKVRLGLEFDHMKNYNFDLMKTGKIIRFHDQKIIRSPIPIS
jgi:hypothetical protein